MDLFEQTAIVVAQADQSGLASLDGPGAHRAFQKPRAEGVQPVDPRHIDSDSAHLRIGAGHGVDLRLERARVLGRPRPGCGRIEAIAAELAADQGPCRHNAAPSSMQKRAERLCKALFGPEYSADRR